MLDSARIFPPSTIVSHRIEKLLFVASFCTFAYFHQGGGWNQNVRFALVRAIVEEGRFPVDSYLIYFKNPAASALSRVNITAGKFLLNGKIFSLEWPGVQGNMIPISGKREANDISQPLEQVAVSGDVSFDRGHFHPAKAPGTCFLAVPAYFLLYRLERLFGINPDQWWVLTGNAWLTCVFSVGLISALGCVLFFRLARELSGASVRHCLLTTLVFAFGTPFFPYATMFYEHDIIAVVLMISFNMLYRVKNRMPISASEKQVLTEVNWTPARINLYILVSGFCSGYAAITNYLQVVAAIFLGLYLIFRIRRKFGWFWYGLGMLGPFLMICIYNLACFGKLLTTNYHFESPFFRSGSGSFLDVFISPQWNVLLAILFSPYRGLFFTSPVLLLGALGLVWVCRKEEFRAEALLFSAIIGFLLLFAASFNGWHGGWAVAPRYLIPMLPFLSLPLVLAFIRYCKMTCALAIFSVAITLIYVAVDPQSPVGNANFTIVWNRHRARKRKILWIASRAGRLHGMLTHSVTMSFRFCLRGLPGLS